MAKKRNKESAALVESNSPQSPGDGPVQSQKSAEAAITPSKAGDLPAGGQIPASDSWASRTERETPPINEPAQRGPYQDPTKPFSVVHNNQAGIKLLKFDRFKQVQLAFASNVSDEIDGTLAARGWKYRPEERVYTKQYGPEGQATALIEATRTYNELVGTLMTEKGATQGNDR